MKKPAKGACRTTKLQKAKECGVVPRAKGPFACFVARNKLNFRSAAETWKKMSQEEKVTYEEASAQLWQTQREQARVAGVRVRWRKTQKAVPSSQHEEAQKGAASSQHQGPQWSGIEIGKDQKYLVGILCGSGTYGVVYKATNCKTGVISAIKIEPRCSTIDNELACLETVRGHPAFLTVEDSHVDWQGMSWMVMPMLRSSLQQLRPVLPDAQMAICLQSMSGLSYMHDNSLVHCDIKPSNIMFCEHTRKVHIIDFGLCRKIPVQDCLGCYTVNYRPPELCVCVSKLRRLWLQPACDCWAFGWTLLECSLGKPFFPGKKEAEVVNSIHEFINARHQARSIQRARWELALEKVPLQMRGIVARLTQKNPGDRRDCKILDSEVFSFSPQDQP